MRRMSKKGFTFSVHDEAKWGEKLLVAVKRGTLGLKSGVLLITKKIAPAG